MKIENPPEHAKPQGYYTNLKIRPEAKQKPFGHGQTDGMISKRKGVRTLLKSRYIHFRTRASARDGAMVAKGAVVTKDVPKACLVAGIPARIIRESVSWIA